MPKHKSVKVKDYKFCTFYENNYFDVSPGFNQTKIKIKKKSNYDV